MKPIWVLALLLWPAMPSASGEFRAAAVKVDITPDTSQWLMGYNARKSSGVHDRIYHRILAMDDGETQFYLVASDLCLFSPAVYDEVASTLRKEMGIEPQSLWWSVTHSHSTPEVGAPGMYRTLLGRSDHEFDTDYARRVADSLVDGVRKAKADLSPARIAIGAGMSMANINRRAKEVSGRVSLGLNPEGPADRRIGVIRLEKPDGSPLAVIANYAMHGTVLGPPNLAVSGDGPGTAAAYVERKLGVPVLYVNGAAGNLAPIYTVCPDPQSGHLSQFGALLGDPVLAALRRMPVGDSDVTLLAGEKILETPRKEGLEWPEELSAYTRSGLVRLPIRFLTIKDTLIWAAPVELFCEISNTVRDRSQFTNTFFFGYTNGWFGYLPTKAAFAEGGYEPKTSPFTDAAEGDLLEAVIAYIHGLSR